MKELWRNSAKLFLKYPILWLPYVCVYLLDASLDILRRASFVPIIHRFSTSRSALSGAFLHAYSEAAQVKAVWLSGAMQWSLRYVTICLGTVALLMTAALVNMIVRGEQPNLNSALAALRHYRGRILGYSLKLFFLTLVFATLVGLPAVHLMRVLTYSAPATGWSRAANFALTQGQLLLSLILFGWIMAPVTIRLLRPLDADSLSPGEKNLGRYFVIVAGFCALTLSASLFPLIVRIFPSRPFPQQVCSSLASLVLSFPFLIGEIGLALIAIGGDWKIGEPAIYGKYRELTRVLMPLHFSGRDEQ